MLDQSHIFSIEGIISFLVSLQFSNFRGRIFLEGVGCNPLCLCFIELFKCVFLYFDLEFNTKTIK